MSRRDTNVSSLQIPLLSGTPNILARLQDSNIPIRYLEEDKSTAVLERRRELQGYQTYLIEQWACSRTNPTFVIVTYTGNAAQTIQVGVLSVPADEEAWSPRLKVYFKALTQYYARRKDTPLGVLMVTNLSGFPSSLSIIHIPNGDISRHREDFIVNEDLKRLGCSGRVGLTIAEPNLATQAKFYQLYKISDKIPFYGAVIELVKLCQAALLIYGCLGAEYVDGLLCDFTEKAINDWWINIGGDIYNVEPTDGTLGPTTVAALLGTLLGARNRLNAYGAPIAKDVFELDSTKRALGYFQKAQRLPRSRRLDRQTLDRLHKATAKQASGEGWNVPRAVKSTVAELSGKGGEMVMDMVGRGEKATIADVEGTDIERFAGLVKGERAKWLWEGKARRRTTRDLFGGGNPTESNAALEGQEQPKEKQYGPMTDMVGLRRQHTKTMSVDDEHETDPPSRRNVFGRAKGRIKDAVGIRGHQHGASKDSANFYQNARNKSVETMASGTTGSPTSPVTREKLDEYFNTDADAVKGKTREARQEPAPAFDRHFTDTPIESKSLYPPPPDAEDYDRNDSMQSDGLLLSTKQPSKSYVPKATLNIPIDERPAQSIGLELRRRQSYSQFEATTAEPHSDNRWPKRLSFGAAEDAVLVWKGPESELSRTNGINLKRDLLLERLQAEDARRMRNAIAILGAELASWVEDKIDNVEEIKITINQDSEQLNSLYYPRRDEYRSLAEVSHEIVAEQKHQIQEAAKDLETLGSKLEYEINSLKTKVEDVEEAVSDFEKQVQYTEARVTELIAQSELEGWVQWLVRIVTRGPKKPKKME